MLAVKEPLVGLGQAVGRGSGEHAHQLVEGFERQPRGELNVQVCTGP